MENVDHRVSDNPSNLWKVFFTTDETIEIIKTREKFDLEISAISKVTANYLAYIKYERNLVKIINNKRKNSELSDLPTVNEVEVVIAMKMKELYEQVLATIPQELRMWEEYIKFLECFKFTSAISGTMASMLKYHNKLDVWLNAIKWELIESPKYNEIYIKTLLERCVACHPDCVKLLNIYGNIEERSRTMSEEALRYNYFTKENPNIDLIALLLFEVSDLLSKMNSKYSIKLELLWNIKAHSELNDYYKSSCLFRKENSIKACVQVYKEAVEKLSTVEMWDLYICTLIELNKDIKTLGKCKSQLLHDTFVEANSQNKISEEHFFKYIDLLFEDKNESIFFVFRLALKRYSNSSAVWEKYMRYYIQIDSEEKVHDTFENAKEMLNSESAYPLWKLYLKYLFTIPCSQKKIEEVYKEATKETNPIFYSFRTEYKDWATFIYGREYAKQILFNK